MKIHFEDTIPFGQEYLSQCGEAKRYSAGSITPEALTDTDILVVRSTTKVDEALLKHASKLRFVTTATAGTNHIDKTYLSSRHISWSSAAGCNAVAVAQYALTAMLRADDKGVIDISRATVGIIGAGHVGSALAIMLDALHIAWVLCDPPLQDAGDPRAFVTLDEALQCDVVTLHVPYVRDGKHPTGNMLNAERLAGLTSKQLLINACRGEVMDEPALKARLQQPDAPLVVLDVFYNEPDIDLELLSLIWLATPHIAGHTVEGKVRGTQMVYEQVCARLGQAATLTLDDFLDETPTLHLAPSEPAKARLNLPDLKKLLFSIYDIQDDDRFFRQGMAKSNQFAAMRKSYRVRREYTAYTIIVSPNLSAGSKQQLQALGFTLITG